MKKRMALFLVAALLFSAGLVISCGGDDPVDGGENGNGTPPGGNPAGPGTSVHYKVTFNADGGTFDDGTTANKVVDTKDTSASNKSQIVGLDNWPEDPVKGTAEFLGWFSGSEYTPNSVITADITLTASWGSVPVITPASDGKSATHDNFLFITAGQAHGGFTGTNDGENGFSLEQGGIKYQFPVVSGFNYSDYDFVELTYTASQTGKADGGAIDGIVMKQFIATGGEDYVDAGSLVAGTDKTVSFEIRKATEGGLAIQKWSAVTANPAVDISITAVTFIKGTRHNISFDADGGSAVTGTYLVEGTKIRDHLPTNTTKAGYIFAGWLYPSGITGYDEGDAVGGGDTVTAEFANITLKAFWLADLELDPIEDIFADLDKDSDNPEDFLTPVSGNGSEGSVTNIAWVTGADDKIIGFKQTGSNWNWVGLSFDIEIPVGATLANYDYVSFTIKGNTDDGTWKTHRLDATDGGGSLVAIAPTEENKTNTGGAEYKMIFTINKPVAAAFSGTVSLSIATGGGGGAVYEITNIKIAQNE